MTSMAPRGADPAARLPPVKTVFLAAGLHAITCNVLSAEEF